MKKETLDFINNLLIREKETTETRVLHDIVFAYNYTDSAKEYKKACDVLDDFQEYVEDLE